jgi:protein-disulfide isomerase
VNPTNVKDKAFEFAGAGVDKAKYDDCFDNKKTQAGVKADQAEGASVGVTGTPSFVINGRLLVGAQPFEQFKAVIDDELASAK